MNDTKLLNYELEDPSPAGVAKMIREFYKSFEGKLQLVVKYGDTDGEQQAEELKKLLSPEELACIEFKKEGE